ncbi:hypothetical protein PI126_g21422 [Phytophthora idaei]|nr:hypothetical protein PI126_g21422 [Phytophthora idaei]
MNVMISRVEGVPIPVALGRRGYKFQWRNNISGSDGVISGADSASSSDGGTNSSVSGTGTSSSDGSTDCSVRGASCSVGGVSCGNGSDNSAVSIGESEESSSDTDASEGSLFEDDVPVTKSEGPVNLTAAQRFFRKRYSKNESVLQSRKEGGSIFIFPDDLKRILPGGWLTVDDKWLQRKRGF